MKRIPLMLTAVLLTIAFTRPCQAFPDMVREGTRPFWVGFGVGPALALANCSTQLLMTQTFGYHFSGDASGPAIAVDLQEHIAGGWFILQFNPRFVWDINIIYGLGLYLTPSIGFGYTVGIRRGEDPLGNDHGLTIPIAFKIKQVLGNRGFIFFQPFSLDMMALFRPGVSYFAMQYDLLFGGGIIF